MEPRTRKPKEGKTQTLPRLKVQAQGRFCEEIFISKTMALPTHFMLDVFF